MLVQFQLGLLLLFFLVIMQNSILNNSYFIQNYNVRSKNHIFGQLQSNTNSTSLLSTSYYNLFNVVAASANFLQLSKADYQLFYQSQKKFNNFNINYCYSIKYKKKKKRFQLKFNFKLFKTLKKKFKYLYLKIFRKILKNKINNFLLSNSFQISYVKNKINYNKTRKFTFITFYIKKIRRRKKKIYFIRKLLYSLKFIFFTLNQKIKLKKLNLNFNMKSYYYYFQNVYDFLMKFINLNVNNYMSNNNIEFFASETCNSSLFFFKIFLLKVLKIK